jgi:hypothetical protein
MSVTAYPRFILLRRSIDPGLSAVASCQQARHRVVTVTVIMGCVAPIDWIKFRERTASDSENIESWYDMMYYL